MIIPLKIAVRNMTLTDSLAEELRERTDKLGHFYPRIQRCRVSIEGPGGHHRQGRFTVRITLSVPRTQLVVSRQGDDDVNVAIREAFEAAIRRLEDRIRIVRRQVKSHPGAPARP